MSHNSNDVAGELLGRTQKRTPTGGHTPDVEKLFEPLTDSASALRSFCTGCGFTSELTKEGAGALAAQAGTNLPDILSGVYFQTTRCLACADIFEGATLQHRQ